MLMGRPEHWYILTTVARIPSPLLQILLERYAYSEISGTSILI